MGESWIVSNLNAALSTWNDKLAEIWSLLTESPQTFKGGQVWGVMTGIHGALQAIGYGLLVLFFAVGVMKTCGSFVEVKKPEHALKLFIRFALAKGAVTYGLELMLAVFSIVQGMVSTIITQSGSSGMSSVTLPQELRLKWSMTHTRPYRQVAKVKKPRVAPMCLWGILMNLN